MRSGLLNEEAKNIKPLNDTRWATAIHSVTAVPHRTRGRHKPASPAALRGAIMASMLTRRAVQNGATTLAETFLFLVGAGIICAETWRSSRKEAQRRDEVHERLDNLEGDVKSIRGMLEGGGAWDVRLAEIREQ